MTGDTRTLADVLKGVVTLLQDGVADLVLIVSAVIGAALCLFALWRLYLATVEARAMGDDVRTTFGAWVAFVFGALLTLLSLVAMRLATLYSGT